MKSIDKIKISGNSAIKDALKIIDRGAMQIALVIDDGGKLLDTITDGDGIASTQIIDVLKKTDLSNILKKSFYDMAVSR
jgi:predicted transcriptional regulator